MLDYPTVYIRYWNKDLADPNSKYDIYIGESNDVIERTKQYYHDSTDSKNWQYDLSHSGVTLNLIIIGHEHFNKSITLDIENRMIQHALGMAKIENVHNRHGNPQNSYYPDDELVNTMLKDGIAALHDGEHPIVHTDRGAHYRWPEWIKIMDDNQLTRTMSKKGYSLDNAACEGFHGRLKNEFFYGKDWRGVSIDSFMQKLDEYMKWYSEKRLKVTLGGKSPLEYRHSLGIAV